MNDTVKSVDAERCIRVASQRAQGLKITFTYAVSLQTSSNDVHLFLFACEESVRHFAKLEVMLVEITSENLPLSFSESTSMRR